MIRHLSAAFLLLTLVSVAAPSTQSVSEERFTLSVLTTGLEFPWEITWGPDGYLWVTERTAKRVTRVNPVDGTQTVAVTISEAFQSIAQDGVLGLALHPGLLQGVGTDYVYVAFTYRDDARSRLKVRRFSYDPGTHQLESPVDLIAGLPAHDDHVAGRLAIGPDEKLYLSIGDQGSNWLQNFCNPNRAQDLPTAADVQARDWTRYEGKILRLNLDGSIPLDNLPVGGVRSHILSYGHRNPQGLAFGLDGMLYASEHGPGTDDELNIIEPGKNYGWPRVAGYQDDRSYAYFNWSASRPASCGSLAFSTSDVPASVPRELESAWSHPDFQSPIQTFFTVSNDYDFRAQGGATIAPSSLAIYTTREEGIPGWADSLLVPGMIKGRMYRQKLSADGRSAVGDPVELFRTANRYRDLAISPDGRTIYVATDTGGRTTGRNGEMTQELEHPGAIMQFTYDDQP
jgi:PQQ-dependent dehydrogenase (s-GDH family)